MPADLMRAVNHALTILNWQENLVAEEVPPEWMWALDEPLEDWFEQVSQVREARMKGRGGGGESDVIVPLVANEHARGRRVAHGR